jgi:hypothetical protein
MAVRTSATVQLKDPAEHNTTPDHNPPDRLESKLTCNSPPRMLARSMYMRAPWPCPTSNRTPRAFAASTALSIRNASSPEGGESEGATAFG